MTNIRVLLLSAVVVTCIGCQNQDRRPVSGEVSYKGQPIVQGRIMFEPVDLTTGVSGGGLIRDGKYSLPASEGLNPGSHTVRITVTLPPVNLRVNADGMATADKPASELLPPQYNRETKLKCEVTSDGPNVFDFRLD